MDYILHGFIVMDSYISKEIKNHLNADNQVCGEELISLERYSLSVARCELNNLTDCTSKGLAIGVSHLGGESRNSVLTIHKTAADNSYSILVMNICISWDGEAASFQFKQAIIAARKEISQHNKLLKSSPSN